MLVDPVRGMTIFHSGCLFTFSSRIEWVCQAIIMACETCASILTPCHKRNDSGITPSVALPCFVEATRGL